MKSFISIAIDGGAGSGKSTTAHNISSKFNFLNVDTGSHYRSITAYLMKHNISEIVASKPENLNKITLSSKIINNKSQIQINGSSFSHSELRSKEINLNVSEQDPLPLVYDSNNWSAGIASNYELDLWGRINAIKSSAKLDAVTAKQAAETLMVTLSAEVALKWNEIIAKRLELTVLQEQISSNKTMLELIELRFNNSLASALDVFQQKQIVYIPQD